MHSLVSYALSQLHITLSSIIKENIQWSLNNNINVTEDTILKSKRKLSHV